MTSEETITITRREYDALLERSDRLEAMLAAGDADAGARVPHEVALDILRGTGPIRAYRRHQGLTLRELSERSGIAVGYLSEIERRRRPGTMSAWAAIAKALGTTIDVLVNGVEAPPPP